MRDRLGALMPQSRCPESGFHEAGDVLLCDRHYRSALEWAEKPRRLAHGIVYYLLRADGLIKIGTTVNFENRAGNLRREYGPLRLMAAERGSYERETDMHDRFRALCAGGEWFRPELPLLKHVAMRRRHQLQGGGLKPDVSLEEIIAMIRALGSDWELPASRKGPQRWRGGRLMA